MKRPVVISALVLGLLGIAGSAQASEWHAASYPATVTTSQNAGGSHSWGLGGVTITCSGTQAHSKMTAASSTLTFTINFASCTSSSLTVSFSLNTCDLEADLGGTESGRFKSTLDIVCSAGPFNIRFSWGTCEVLVPAQNGLGSAYAENVSSETGYDVLFEAGVTGMAYEVTKDGFLCPLSGTGQKTGGTYTGNYGFFGESSGGSRIQIHATD
jgi:hypothetical protein